METWSGGLGGMDLLKDITDGLRGDDQTRRNDESDPATTVPRDDGSAGEPGRDDEHVCSFCRTAFDADRRSCPECDAEIVLRGAR